MPIKVPRARGSSYGIVKNIQGALSRVLKELQTPHMALSRILKGRCQEYLRGVVKNIKGAIGSSYGIVENIKGACRNLEAMQQRMKLRSDPLYDTYFINLFKPEGVVMLSTKKM